MKKGQAILITATDTGAGKTYISCLLGEAIRREGLTVHPLKPVESGCEPGMDGTPFPSDASSLREAIAPHLRLSEVCLYALSAPLSPHLAAREDGVAIDTGQILAAVQKAEKSSDIVLVEAVGGIAVEIHDGYFLAELARDARLPVLVVAENRLGILNHLRLTERYLRSEGLSLLGVILNDRTPDRFPAREPNEAEVRRIAGDRYLGRIPHGAPSLPEGILSALFGILTRQCPLPPDNSL